MKKNKNINKTIKEIIILFFVALSWMIASTFMLEEILKGILDDPNYIVSNSMFSLMIWMCISGAYLIYRLFRVIIIILIKLELIEAKNFSRKE